MRSNSCRAAALFAAFACVLTVAAQNEPYIVHETKPVIIDGPYLLAPTETSVTIAWTTDTPCHSKVLYGPGGDLSRELEAPENGLLPIGVHHTFRLTGLEPGKQYSYRAVSTRVVRMKTYWPEKGLAVESPIYAFTTFDRKKPAVSFSAITDTHADVSRITTAAKRVDWKTTDFFVHLGDGWDGVENEEMILSRFLDPISSALHHTVPLVYARGNHDTRGAAARSLLQFIPLPDGKFYYMRDDGPLRLIVLDTGEDKDDSTNVYAGLNRFKAYHEEEFAWFQQQVRAGARMSDAPFRVLLMHAPDFGFVGDQRAKWIALANEAKIDSAISGHQHTFHHNPPDPQGKNYHELVVGQDNLARVDATATELKVAVTNKTGDLVEQFTIRR